MVTNDVITQTNATLHSLMVTKWLSEELFSIKWWGVIGFIVTSYILCFSLLDKTRLSKTILFGSLISVFSVVVDILGTNFILWTYTIHTIPITPSIFIYDITALPLYYMLIYQHAYSWKSFAVWNIAASVIMAFVFTPLMVKLGFLHFINWPYINVFLMISFIGFLAKSVTSLIFSFENQYRAKQRNFETSAILQPAMKPLGDDDEK